MLPCMQIAIIQVNDGTATVLFIDIHQQLINICSLIIVPQPKTCLWPQLVFSFSKSASLATSSKLGNNNLAIQVVLCKTVVCSS